MAELQKSAFFFFALNPLFQITWREKSSVICSVIMSEVSRGSTALLFLSAEALKVEPVVVCALSNDKSDLSYQTYTACVRKSECVCVCVQIMYLSCLLCV